MNQRLFYLFTLCLAVVGVKAQNYQTVNSGREAYFSYTGTDFNFLRIDSVAFDGDSVLLPQLTLEYDYDERGCLPRRASWAGPKIIIRSNGTNVYFNHNLDSIVIKTYAKLNDKWMAYQIPNTLSIEAEVTKVQEETFLELTDTVKTIQFRVFDATGILIDHRLNNMPIELSKNYGWKTALNFNLFPYRNLFFEFYPQQPYTTYKLIGLKNPKVGIQNLTWFDVYDFQPGDVQHVYESQFNCCDGGGPCEHFYKRTINKYLTRRNYYPDSIVYSIDREQQNITIQSSDTTNNSVERDTIRQVIRANPKFDKLSGELSFSEDSSRIDFVFQYLREKTYKIYPLPFYYREKNHSWNQAISGEEGYVIYIKGFGEQPFYFSPPCSGKLHEVQYYKLGDKEWGIPFTFTGVEKLTNVDRFKVYPNPASKMVTIETGNPSATFTFRLFTTDGKLVGSESLKGERPTVEVGHLNQGLYYYQVLNGTQLESAGNLVVYH
jgi:hypothetical protein